MIMNKSLGSKLKEKVNAKIYEWKTNTLYAVDDVIVESNILYKCITRHTSNTWANEKNNWLAINIGGGISGTLGYSQITKMGVSMPMLVNIPIEETVTFCTPPVEVLKFAQGAQGQMVNLITFDSGDGIKFLYNTDSIVFNGTMELNYNYTINMSQPSMITDGTAVGYISESEEIDMSKYKNVSNVRVFFG